MEKQDRAKKAAATKEKIFSTAVGLFKSIINVVLLVGANFIIKKVSGSGLFA